MAKPFKLELWMDAKPPEVFAVLADLDAAKAWHPTILAVKRLDEGGPLKAGSAWIETRAGRKGKPFVSTIRVTRFEPDSAFGLHIDAKPVKMDCGFQLFDVKGGTRVEYEATMKPKGLGMLFGGKMRKMMAEMDADLLPRLCSVVEARRAAKPAKKAVKAAAPARKPAAKKAAKKAK